MAIKLCHIFQSQPGFWKLVLGVVFGIFLTSEIRWLIVPGYKDLLQCKHLIKESYGGGSHPSPSKQQPPTKRPIENTRFDITQKELLLVGVMTANKYLDNRAVAAYNTWGKNVPGKILFFSSETSNLSLPLPIVALPTVDDSYPPQKKSFLMLKYMYENYGDKFEWFMRADDDVYLRTDKLEKFLRKVNSSKTLFIGQAGRGLQEEFGLLSLEYDENYCMGGPGIIMSHATLAKVAPNVKDCLRNLYTTHEDVEVGRCVQKFAGVPCTWSYEMQLIMYHNSSGREAFTGKLKSKEVHRAISLHPVKQHKYLYRVHNYMNTLKIEDLTYDSVKLRREIKFVEDMLTKKGGKFELTSDDNSDWELEKADKSRLSLLPSLTKDRPINESLVIPWDFVSRTLFSTGQSNPRRKLEGALKESIDDIVREVMESINTVSKERGRIIDFKDVLYGYHRVVPLYGSDYILDLLLIYKKYRGRKMTVPVRRHSYLQRAFTTLQLREITCQPGSGRLNACDKLVYNSDLFSTGKSSLRLTRRQGRRLLRAVDGKNLKPESMDYYADLEKEYPGNKMVGLLKQIDIQQQEAKKDYQEQKVEEKQEYSEQKVDKESVNDESDILQDDYEEEPLHLTANEEIYFVVPLSGRIPVFKRFLKNYQSVCLASNEPVQLILVLYPDPKDSQSKSLTFDLIQTVQDKNSNFKVKVIEPDGAFSRGVALELGANACPEDGLMFLVDVDMSFTTEALERIRLNTIRNNQIYYPIVFSEFDPSSVYRKSESPDHFLISESSGYWRFFGYGIVSLYHCDLRFIGGYDTSITGWGKEDVDLFDKAVKSNLTIFRSVDPGLSHVFHSIECDDSLESKQRDMCVNSKANTYVSQKVLAQFLVKDTGFREYLAKTRSEG